MSNSFNNAMNAATTKEERDAVVNEYIEEVKALTDEELFLMSGGTIFDEPRDGRFH